MKRVLSARPTVVHVSSFQFGRRHHPATWRTIVGLGRQVRNVVVCGRNPGYFREDDPDSDRSAAEAAIAVHRVPDVGALLRPEEAASLAATLRLRYGPIHVIVGHLKCGGRVTQLAKHLSTPIIAYFHGSDANIELNGAELGPAYARLRTAPAAFFLAVSENLVERLIAFGMPRERTFRHHLGIDLDRYPMPQQRETGPPVKIVMAGRFRTSKGHKMAIRGFAKFVQRFPGASLRLIGNGSNSDQPGLDEELAAFVETMGLAGSVQFCGVLAVDALAREFARADIALQTSVFVPKAGQIEGIPNTILEAMASGLPVVATRHGGIPEAVLHEQTGLLVEEDDIDGLAQALGRLAAAHQLRHEYGRAGRKWVEEEFESVRQSERLAERIAQMRAAYDSLDIRERETRWESCTGDAAPIGASARDSNVDPR
jgi:colanic acid/amylovoran biosynthesis glycosyltransferase